MPRLAEQAAKRWKQRAATSSRTSLRAAALPEAEQQQRQRAARLDTMASTTKAASLARAADAIPAAAGRQDAVLSSIGYERVIGKSDLLGVDFLELAIAMARGVGRVRSGNEFGTGVLVGPRLMITNNHVISDAAMAAGSWLDMDYQQNSEREMLPVHSYRMRPDVLFTTSKALDYTVVALEEVSDKGRPLAAYPWARMIADTAKLALGDAINIIQHPNGGLKQIALRENTVIGLTGATPNFLEYTTDTEPGSSGAGCFNDQWELVAIHHAGVPRTNAQGKILTMKNQVWHKGESEDSIAWISNEGVRISAIVNDLQTAALSPAQKTLVNAMLTATPPNPIELARVKSAGQSTTTTPATGTATLPVQIGTVHGGSIQLPLTITVSVGTQAAGVLSAPDATLESVTIDPDYGARKGYDPLFLDGKLSVALPSLTAAQLKATAQLLPDYRGASGKYAACELRYWNYSVLMNTTYRTAWFSAANVDGDERPQLPKRSGDKWFNDPRMALDEQLTQEAFETGIDRGHLTRRDDAAWGATLEIATKSTNDTFHFTNCSLQASAFNRGADRWQGLEQFLLEKHAKKDKRRIMVFTGPVFDAKNPMYRNDKMSYSVPCPLQFWKVCVLIRESDGKPSATAFMLGQQEISQLPGFEAFDVGASQLTLASLETLTGLSFGRLKSYDLFAKTGRKGVLEAMVAGGRRRLLRDFDDIVV
ncbi:MAG: DNA/RNA non-specific endonuclease [Edaphobacter sp.]|uniref:DNA/RNA non-specific endonuclease n=1 Tax=Edaphobacter sp. TaxID=1934404 RepID=UPI0023920EDB|nr:DNA/RNA non-specific endonuclease [Edaphobacter sp.]MDE1176736.1 DNA/RNA non-specific endonuclease [Edaphobacter sp.]